MVENEMNTTIQVSLTTRERLGKKRINLIFKGVLPETATLDDVISVLLDGVKRK